MTEEEEEEEEGGRQTKAKTWSQRAGEARADQGSERRRRGSRAQRRRGVEEVEGGGAGSHGRSALADRKGGSLLALGSPESHGGGSGS